MKSAALILLVVLGVVVYLTMPSGAQPTGTGKDPQPAAPTGTGRPPASDRRAAEDEMNRFADELMDLDRSTKDRIASAHAYARAAKDLVPAEQVGTRLVDLARAQPDPEFCAGMIQAMKGLKSHNLLGYLSDAALDNDRRVRAEAMRTLMDFHDLREVRTLAQQVRDHDADPEVRRLATELLATPPGSGR